MNGPHPNKAALINRGKEASACLPCECDGDQPNTLTVFEIVPYHGYSALYRVLAIF